MKLFLGLTILCFSQLIFAKDSTFEELFIERIRPQIESQIKSHFSNDTLEVNWSRFKVPDQIAKLESELAKKIKLNPIKYEGKGVVVIQFEVSGNQYAFTAEYRIYQEVYVSARAILSIEKMNKNDLNTQKMDVTYLNDRPVKLEDFVGRSTNRTIPSGQIIVLSDLKKEPLVERGQSVKIQMNTSGLEISAIGVAEQSGFENDWIKVTNPESKKTILTQVIERGTVEIK